MYTHKIPVIFSIFSNVFLKGFYFTWTADEIFGEILPLKVEKFIEIVFQVGQHIVFHIGKLKDREVVLMNLISCDQGGSKIIFG